MTKEESGCLRRPELTSEQRVKLETIIARVEKATGPNYALECEIAKVLEPDRKLVSRNYTNSLDAVHTLAQRILPGSEWELSTIYGRAWAKGPLNMDEAYQSVGRADDNLVLAWLECVIRAKSASATLARKRHAHHQRSKRPSKPSRI